MKFFSLLVISVLLTACANESSPDTATTTSVTEVKPTPAPVVQPVETANIIKFFDYACTHCRSAHYTVKNLETEFGDQVAFEYKHYPLSAETYLVAETAECARRQDLFEPYHNALFENNFQNYEPENLQAVAESVGVDMETFNTCVANGGGRSRVQADVDEATAMGVSGTPYFLINNSIPLPGAIPEQSFSRLITQVLAGEVR